ncbi:MAG: CPBP family intramembrane metalloprotease [Candidatus Brocadiaceae bacterium]|nr:CPBP family intramembrane metalloprotease [Candidatus Brocadiaceae bacterium]
MNGKSCPWDLADVVKVFLFYIIMLGVGCPLLLHLLEKTLPEKISTPSSSNILLLLTLLINTAVCLYIFKIVSRRCTKPLSAHRPGLPEMDTTRSMLTTLTCGAKALGLSLKGWRRNLPGGLLLYLLAFPLILSAGQLVEYTTRVLNGTPQHQEVITRLMKETSPGIVTSMLFFAALFGPFTEEILFRGFLQPALREAVGAWKAILLSAFLFASVHLNVYVFLQIFLLGLVLAYLFEKTGTLLSPIFIHMLHNITTLTYLLLNKREGNSLDGNTALLGVALPPWPL